MVRRVLSAFDPSLLIFLETEIWPNLLRSAFRKGIPTLLLSGRLSSGSFRRYLFFRLFFSQVVQQLSAAGMQTEEDAERMARLGADPRKICITGNLKHASWRAEGVRNDGPEGSDLLLGAEQARQVLVAGSTHRGEEEILLDVFLLLKSSFPGLLMVLAPRHPQRFAEVERLLKKRQVSYERKSRLNGQGRMITDVIFLDTIGELAAFYSLADIAFVGGSLVNAGGHNLMEPARLRKPVLFGPYMQNFTDIAEELKQKGGGIEIHGKEDLIREIAGLLSDRVKAERMGELAYRVVEEDRGVVEKSMDLVARYL
jgi:3-deoxy-D-manno-octulosonic-acid transferase